MNGKKTWVVGGLLVLGLLIAALSQLTAQRPPAARPLGGEGPVGRYAVVLVDRGDVILLEQSTHLFSGKHQAQRSNNNLDDSIYSSGEQTCGCTPEANGLKHLGRVVVETVRSCCTIRVRSALLHSPLLSERIEYAYPSIAARTSE